MKGGVTGLPREPKEKPMETSALGEDVLGVELTPIFEGTPNPKIPLLVRDDIVGGSASTPQRRRPYICLDGG